MRRQQLRLKVMTVRGASEMAFHLSVHLQHSHVRDAAAADAAPAAAHSSPALCSSLLQSSSYARRSENAGEQATEGWQALTAL